MDKHNVDKLQRLSDLPNTYEVDPNLAKRAISQIEAKEAEKVAKKPFAWWKQLSVGAAAVVLFLSVFLPLYLSPKPLPPEQAYFDDSKLTVSTVDDFTQFVLDNQLQIEYFEATPTILNQTNKKAVVSETNKLGYVMQGFSIIGSDLSFPVENVELSVIVLDNTSYDFEKKYDICDQKSNINNIAVYYKTVDNLGIQEIVCKFTYAAHEYFMAIECSAEADVEAKLQEYITLLLL